MKKNVLLILVMGMFFNLSALKLNRVILATDQHANYIEFWPIVAQAWRRVAGVRPTLALIGGPEVQVDESYGDVIRYAPIEGVPTWFQAQTIRLLLPTLFPDDVCIISDMDMLPINRKYFVESIANLGADKFVVYNNNNRNEVYQKRFPICYLAAKGRVFGEILKIDAGVDFSQVIKTWFGYGLSWDTDELILYRSVTNWSGYPERLIKLNYGNDPRRRIDRAYWRYDKHALFNYYYDSHMLRPYHQFKKQIDKLIKDLGWK